MGDGGRKIVRPMQTRWLIGGHTPERRAKRWRRRGRRGDVQTVLRRGAGKLRGCSAGGRSSSGCTGMLSLECDSSQRSPPGRLARGRTSPRRRRCNGDVCFPLVGPALEKTARFAGLRSADQGWGGQDLGTASCAMNAAIVPRHLGGDVRLAIRTPHWRTQSVSWDRGRSVGAGDSERGAQIMP
jgi:hypothetical protein